MISDINRISEERAIEETIYAMVKDLDEKNWEELPGYFQTEVSFNMSSLSGEPASLVTPNEIINDWKDGLDAVDSVHHQFSNFRVDVDGEVARAFCYSTAYHAYDQEKSELLKILVGTYDFSLLYMEGKWIIVGLTYHSKFIREIA